MSSPELKKALAWVEEESMKMAYPHRPKKTDKLARRELEKAKGQILIINEIDYLTPIQPLYKINILSEEVRSELFKLIDAFFKAGEAKLAIDADTLKQVKANAKANVGGDPLDHIYIVSSFDSAKAKKYKKSNKEDVSQVTANYLNKLSRQRVKAKDISAKHDIGHGDKGMSAAEYTMASRTRQASQKFDLTEKEEKMMQDVIIMEAKKLGIKVNFTHDQVLDSKGNIRKEWSVVLNFQDRTANSRDAKLEAALKDNIRKRFEKIALNPNSTPLIPAISQTLMFNLKPRPGMIVKGSRKSKIAEKSKARYNKKHNYKEIAEYGVIKGQKIKKGLLNPPRSQKSPSASARNLPSLLNKNLKQTVRDNMGAPALENQTGNFAQSVEVLKVLIGSGKTLPSIQYTYQQDPYAVFETGARGDSRWASTDRDPRILIDRSLREVAREYALGKFTTQRV